MNPETRGWKTKGIRPCQSRSWIERFCRAKGAREGLPDSFNLRRSMEGAPSLGTMFPGRKPPKLKTTPLPNIGRRQGVNRDAGSRAASGATAWCRLRLFMQAGG